MRISFIHIADQVQYDPMTASLAGLLKERMWMCWHVFTDFSTTKEGFVAQVRSHEPLAVAFRVSKETREIVGFLARAVAEQPEKIPVFFYGPLCQTHPDEVVGLADPAVVLLGEPEVGFDNLLKVWKPGQLPPMPPPTGVWISYAGQIAKGADPAPADLDLIPKPDLTVFGGDRVFRRGVGAGFFGELKVLPFLTGYGTPSGMPANANLHNFSYATQFPPRLLDLDTIVFRLRALGPRVDHIELWDREFGWNMDLAKELLPTLHRRQRKKTYSIRVLPETFDAAVLDLHDPERTLRVVAEYDAATVKHHQRLGWTQHPEKTARVVEETRKRGIEPALLISVGLPEETAADIEAKLDFVRQNGVTRVRFFPFEPAYGHPVWKACNDAGMLSGRGDAWNREIIRPLSQPSLDIEEWHVVWQKCLNLETELQAAYAADFEPAGI